MLWDPFLYCINDSIQGKSETGNKVFVLPSKVSINSMGAIPISTRDIMIIFQIKFIMCYIKNKGDNGICFMTVICFIKKTMSL